VEARGVRDSCLNSWLLLLQYSCSVSIVLCYLFLRVFVLNRELRSGLDLMSLSCTDSYDGCLF